jgi:hypothetical protein
MQMQTQNKNETAKQPEPPKTREEVLKMSLEAREQEVMMYQINIDNYSMALDHIGLLSRQDREDLKEFANQLSGLLASEQLEQKKAKIMLDVIKQQVKEI